MNFFPLWIASVWPMNSGSTVERRDQVLTTFFSRARFIASTFFSSLGSMYGPFFNDRDTSPPGALLAPLHDVPVGLLPPGPRLHLALAPRAARMAAARALALATPQRVVVRIHRDAPHRGADAEPAGAPGLAQRDVLVLEVAQLPERGHALQPDLPHLARGQPQQAVRALLGHELG